MRTLNEKVKSLMDFIGIDCAEDRAAIEKALKEQDRDTRHACAEAVIRHGDADPLEIIDLCHNACMNAKAI